MNPDIDQALITLRNGGIILYPTDTIWGIGCDATVHGAVKRIYSVKKREDHRAMLLLVDSTEMLYNYVESVPETALSLIEVSEEPLTIIYPGGRNLPDNLLAEDGSVGIRITADPFCKALITKFGKPIVSTSANISSDPPPGIYADIDHEIIGNVDYVVKWRQEESLPARASGIIRVEYNGVIKVIRE
jgi:L-threonylcarbamoyladenylate synthase